MSNLNINELISINATLDSDLENLTMTLNDLNSQDQELEDKLDNFKSELIASIETKNAMKAKLNSQVEAARYSIQTKVDILNSYSDVSCVAQLPLIPLIPLIPVTKNDEESSTEGLLTPEELEEALKVDRVKENEMEDRARELREKQQKDPETFRANLEKTVAARVTPLSSGIETESPSNVELSDEMPQQEYDPSMDERLDEVNRFLTEGFGMSLVGDQLTSNQVETIKSFINKAAENNPIEKVANVCKEFLDICDGVLTDAQKAEFKSMSFDNNLVNSASAAQTVERFQPSKTLVKLLPDAVKAHLKTAEVSISFIDKLSSLSEKEQMLRLTWHVYFDGATYFMERLGSSKMVTGETNSMIQQVAIEKGNSSIINFVLENFSSYIYPNYVEEMNAVKTRILSEEIPF